MASTYSNLLRFEKQTTGENDDTWGDKLNTLFELIEDSISGKVSVAQGDVANLTLSTANGVTDEARCMFIDITGALTAARNVVVPTSSKFYVVRNSTTGGFAITVKTTAGTGISIYNGKTAVLLCDGTNVIDPTDNKLVYTQGTGLTFTQTGNSVSVSITTQIIEGNCKLSKSGANLILLPHKGRILSFPAGQALVPAAGVTLSTSGLTAATTYYIYAVQSAGAVTGIEASATTHVTDSTTGIEVKSGDTTRVLVGLARVNGSSLWEDTASNRLVRSWFHDTGVSGAGQITLSTAISGSPWVEMSSARCNVLTWSGEEIDVSLTATCIDTTVAGNLVYASVGYDGSFTGNGSVTSIKAVSQYSTLSASAVISAATEVMHSINLLTGTGGGSPTMYATSGITYSTNRR